MIGSFLITLREGLEAALIIGIILAYLAKTGNRQGFKPIWIGTALGVFASLVAGAIITLPPANLRVRRNRFLKVPRCLSPSPC